jgi:hypothetical protein
VGKYFAASASKNVKGSVVFRSGLFNGNSVTNLITVEEARELAGELLAAADEAGKVDPVVLALSEDLEDTESGNFKEWAVNLIRRGWVKVGE